MSKITFLIDPQPKECSQYVLKLSLSVLIRKFLIKKEYNTRFFH